MIFMLFSFLPRLHPSYIPTTVWVLLTVLFVFPLSAESDEKQSSIHTFGSPRSRATRLLFTVV